MDVACGWLCPAFQLSGFSFQISSLIPALPFCFRFVTALGGFEWRDIPGSRSWKTRTFLARFPVRAQETSLAIFHPSSSIFFR
jgi:hypothetical protein